MQDIPSADPLTSPSLIRNVAGHLFTFEEKIFGMSLTQLLTDLGVLAGSFSFTGSLPLLPHLLLCALITGLALIVVHGSIQGLPLSFWGYLLLRSKMLPARTIWRSQQDNNSSPAAQEASLPSVQATWIPIDTLSQGIAGQIQHQKQGDLVRYWTTLEIEGKTIHLLPELEQERIFRRFEGFLTGLTFHLQLLSFTEQLDPHTAPALLVQQDALAALARTPQIQSFQRRTLHAQARELTTSTRTRQFLILSASGAEPALRHPDGQARSLLSTIMRVVARKQASMVSREQILDQLRVRTTVVRQAIRQLDLRAWQLEDQELLQLFASCLVPGNTAPSFVPELLPSPDDNDLRKRIQGIHGSFDYTSMTRNARLETDALTISDLLAPSAITVRPDALHIQAGPHTRYVRAFTVTGYGHHLLCGWISALHDLGLPLLVSCHLEPTSSQLMIVKLEHALTRLESQRLFDQKTLRITHADQHLEAEEIRAVTRALASRQRSILDVSLTICVHASSLERLEQRSRYLLSQLRSLHLLARPAIYQQDLAWQSCLPMGLDHLQNWVKLTSDVVSTMLPGTSGTVGTPTGVFLGYTESSQSRQPVYLNPWSTEKKMANPHIVVIGETGQGKSWLGKTLVTGFMGLGIADVCVLDKDDEYQPLHEALRGESQCYHLARRCPINLFDLPFGPADVDPDDPADLLAEFFEHSLLTGLSLLVTDEETRLSKGEEAYLMRVARAAYAACGITSDAIHTQPELLLQPVPTLTDFMQTMQTIPASSKSLRASLLERLEKAAYLFHGGQTSISLDKPLTIFSIKGLDSRWFAFMTFLVQQFLMRHRALRRDDRYLVYLVEEASYLLKHSAGRRYLENGSRGFRKLGIAQITLSQQPRDFLDAGQVVLSNAGTVFYLGMPRTAVEQLQLPEPLERLLIDSVPGQGVLRIGNTYAPLTVWSNPVYRTLFTTDPVEQRALRQQAQRHVSGQQEHIQP